MRALRQKLRMKIAARSQDDIDHISQPELSEYSQNTGALRLGITEPHSTTKQPGRVVSRHDSSPESQLSRSVSQSTPDKSRLVSNQTSEAPSLGFTSNSLAFTHAPQVPHSSQRSP